jgi:hypothetical protein
MDERLMKRIRDVARTSDQNIETSLIETLVELGGARHTVRGARDKFGAVLGKARNGEAQLIGCTPEDMTVVISLKDLAELVRMVAEPESFGEALDAAGFKPAVGRRIVVREGREQNPLTRYREEDEDPNS